MARLFQGRVPTSSKSHKPYYKEETLNTGLSDSPIKNHTVQANNTTCNSKSTALHNTFDSSNSGTRSSNRQDCQLSSHSSKFKTACVTPKNSSTTEGHYPTLDDSRRITEKGYNSVNNSYSDNEHQPEERLPPVNKSLQYPVDELNDSDDKDDRYEEHLHPLNGLDASWLSQYLKELVICREELFAKPADDEISWGYSDSSDSDDEETLDDCGKKILTNDIPRSTQRRLIQTTVTPVMENMDLTINIDDQSQELSTYSEDQSYPSNTTCWNCGQKGHKTKSCTNKRQLVCYACDAIGHENQDCPILAKYYADAQNEEDDSQDQGHPSIKFVQTEPDYCEENPTTSIQPRDLEFDKNSASKELESAIKLTNNIEKSDSELDFTECIVLDESYEEIMDLCTSVTDEECKSSTGNPSAKLSTTRLEKPLEENSIDCSTSYSVDCLEKRQPFDECNSFVKQTKSTSKILSSTKNLSIIPALLDDGKIEENSTTSIYSHDELFDENSTSNEPQQDSKPSNYTGMSQDDLDFTGPALLDKPREENADLSIPVIVEGSNIFIDNPPNDLPLIQSARLLNKKLIDSLTSYPVDRLTEKQTVHKGYSFAKLTNAKTTPSRGPERKKKKISSGTFGSKQNTSMRLDKAGQASQLKPNRCERKRNFRIPWGADKLIFDEYMLKICVVTQFDNTSRRAR